MTKGRLRRWVAAAAVTGGVLVAGVGIAAPAWAPPANTPHSKADCKNGGWKTHTDAQGNAFRNQGQCVSWVEHNVDHHGHGKP